jgi:hypothetical protein
MIKINETPPVGSVRRTAKKNNISHSDENTPFADIMEMLENAASVNELATQTIVQTTASLSALDGLLAVQEADAEATFQRQQIKRAHLALDSLEDLRHAMLLGAIPAYLLGTIETRMNDLKHHVQDAHVREIIEEVELRAAVELAKLRMQR